MTIDTLKILFPEVLLVVLAVWVIVGGAFSQVRAGWAWLSAITLASVIMVLWQQAERIGSPTMVVDPNRFYPLIVDPFAQTFRMFAAFVGILFVLGTLPNQKSQHFTESVGVLVFVFIGIMIVGNCGDLILLFLGLELISIPTYVLLYLGRRDRSSMEATAKYFFLSILSSAILLYGLSMLYGMAGSTNLPLIQTRLMDNVALTESAVLPLYPMAIVFILLGLCFKISAFPFHFYAPDVFQAATNMNAALLSVAPKVAGIVAMIRILVWAVPSQSDFQWQILIVLSVLSMTVGNVAALWQTNIRRMLAYSSIANSGYMLIGLATAVAAKRTGASPAEGIGATTLYVFVYSVGVLGAFAILAYLDDGETEFRSTSQLAGISKRHPLVAGILAICLFSLTGIPPLAGFWGKFLVFKGAVGVAVSSSDSMGIWFWVLLVVAAVNTAIAAAYYLRVIGLMFFKPAQPAIEPRYLPTGSIGPGMTSAVCAFFILISIFPGKIMKTAFDAAAHGSSHLEVSVETNDPRNMHRVTNRAEILNQK